MIRKDFRRKRLVLGLAVAAAFAAPVSAQAMVVIDGPTGGEQAYVIPKSHGSVVQSPAQAAVYQLKVDRLSNGASTVPLVTDHGGQNRGLAAVAAHQVKVDRLSNGGSSTVPLVTDHGGQNRGPAVYDLGPLDPWAVHLVHPGGLTVARAPVTGSVESPGFVWRDAGIGAGVTIGAMILVAAGAVLLTRRRGVAHAH